MSLSRKIAHAITAFAAVSTLTVGTYAAAAETPPPSSSPVPPDPSAEPSSGTDPVVRRHADYLPPGEGGRPEAARAAVEDQCARPIAERTGAWACSATRGKVAALPARMGVKLAGGTCSAAGCWNRVGKTHAEFTGQGNYGHNQTKLGDVTFFVKILMNGARSTSKPVRFKSTRGTKNVDFEGERLYLSNKYPGGNGVNDGASYAFLPTGPHVANKQVEWLPNGYSSYENTTAFASIVHQFTWRDPSSSYPGRWFFFVKSLKLTKQGSGAYWFMSDTDLPTDWFGSGYRA